MLLEVISLRNYLTYEDRMAEKKHLAIACGGTGGHFYPTLAIAREFCNLGNRVTLLVAGKHAPEQLELAEKSGLPAVEMPFITAPQGIGGLFSLPFKFWNGWTKAKVILKEVAPDVVLGMGSYASWLTCWTVPKSIPLVLHEGNAFMGRANRMLITRARGIGLSLPLRDEGQLKGTPSKCLGMPLRDTLIKAALNPVKDEGFLPSLGLENGIPTILVFGGSQGARRINELFTEMAGLMDGFAGKVQFMHLTGTDDNAALTEAYRASGVKASIRRADSSIEKCYLASDLVICRGGASSLCELALFEKPAVIIPLPTAADDHQTVNAKLAESVGGAIHLPQATATAAGLKEIVTSLLADSAKFKAMGERLKVLAHPDAAKEMAAFIAELAD